MPEYRINVVVDESRAVRGIQGTGRALDGLGDRASRLTGLLSRTFAAIGVGIGGADIIRRIAGFSSAMAQVQAVTGATATQFDTLRARARELGSETQFSATQAAEAMGFLARAGFETDAILRSIGSTLDLAAVGALDLGTAADIASNVLTGFRLEAEEMGRVVDVLALAASSSNTNIQQLGEAMAFAAPVAAGLGVSVEESAAAIGALSDAGIQASTAGTGLRRVMSTLETPTSAVTDVLGRLGLTADDVRVSQVGLTTAMTRLADAGVDTGTALELFGDRGGPAFAVLSNALPRVVEMTGALEGAAGTSRRLAEIMNDNLQGALLSVGSAYEAVILAFGELGTESLLTQSFFALADALRFVAENMRTAATVATSLLLALALPRLRAIAAGLLGVASAAGSVATAFGIATAAVRLFLRAAVIGLVIEGIQTLVDFIDRGTAAFARFNGVLGLFGVEVQAATDAVTGQASALAMVSEGTEELARAQTRAAAAAAAAGDAQRGQSETLAAVADGTSALSSAEAERAMALEAVGSETERYREELEAILGPLRGTGEEQAAVNAALDEGRGVLDAYDGGLTALASSTVDASDAQQSLVAGLRQVSAEAEQTTRTLSAAQSAIDQLQLGSVGTGLPGQLQIPEGAQISFDQRGNLTIFDPRELGGIDLSGSFGQRRGFALGTGYVDGPPGVDRIPARLTRGEAVLTTEAVRRNPGLAERLNRGERAGDNITVNINVATPDADSFLRSREQIRRREITALTRARQRAR